MPGDSSTTMDDLMGRLREGDERAAGELFRLCQSQLRRVVRRHMVPGLRAKLDSVDIVQSVWLQFLHDLRASGERIRDGEHLMAYLTRAARHRLIDRFRRHRAALRREQPLSDGPGPPAAGPQPSQAAQAAETWEQIQALCSPSEAAVVRLRRDGLKVDEIADRTGRHPSSVRRLLYDLARRLGAGRDAEP